MTRLTVTLILLVSFVLFSTTVSATNHTVEGCYNATHQVREFTGSDAEAKQFQVVPEEYIACPFGCDNSTGACYDLAGVVDYAWLGFVGHLVVIIFSYFMVWFWNERANTEEGADNRRLGAAFFRFFFIFLALLFHWSLLNMFSIIGVESVVTEVASISNIMMMVATVVSWVSVFLLFYFMLMLFINTVKAIPEKRRKKALGRLGDLDV